MLGTAPRHTNRGPARAGGPRCTAPLREEGGAGGDGRQPPPCPRSPPSPRVSERSGPRERGAGGRCRVFREIDVDGGDHGDVDYGGRAPRASPRWPRRRGANAGLGERVSRPRSTCSTDCFSEPAWPPRRLPSSWALLRRARGTMTGLVGTPRW
jgi:hypothetical protein